MADGDCRGIGGVRRQGLLQVQQGHHHLPHLALVRPPVPAHGLLHLHGVVVAHGQAMKGAREQDPPPDLAQLQGRGRILLHEGRFHGHVAGVVGGDGLRQPFVDAEDPLIEIRPPGTADDARLHQSHPGSEPLHHGPATGQGAWIHPQAADWRGRYDHRPFRLPTPRTLPFGGLGWASRVFPPAARAFLGGRPLGTASRWLRVSCVWDLPRLGFSRSPSRSVAGAASTGTNWNAFPCASCAFASVTQALMRRRSSSTAVISTATASPMVSTTVPRRPVAWVRCSSIQKLPPRAARGTPTSTKGASSVMNTTLAEKPWMRPWKRWPMRSFIRRQAFHLSFSRSASVAFCSASLAPLASTARWLCRASGRRSPRRTFLR